MARKKNGWNPSGCVIEYDVLGKWEAFIGGWRLKDAAEHIMVLRETHPHVDFRIVVPEAQRSNNQRTPAKTP